MTQNLELTTQPQNMEVGLELFQNHPAANGLNFSRIGQLIANNISRYAVETKHLLNDKKTELAATTIIIVASGVAGWGAGCFTDPKTMGDACGSSPFSTGVVLEVSAAIAYGVAIFILNSKYDCFK